MLAVDSGYHQNHDNGEGAWAFSRLVEKLACRHLLLAEDSDGPSIASYSNSFALRSHQQGRNFVSVENISSFDKAWCHVKSIWLL